MHDDPNFPTGLSIGPSQRAVLGGLHLDEGGDGDDDAAQDVERFGIAGRTWEAAYLALSYLRLSASSSSPRSPTSPVLDPPCPVISTNAPPPASSAQGERHPARKRTILELGAGTGFLSLALAPHLCPSSLYRLVVTDLPNVCPLLEENLAAASRRWIARDPHGPTMPAEVCVRPLPWGDDDALRALQDEGIEPDLVLASDLIYFEFLYAPLLRTLLGLTEPRGGHADKGRGSPQVVFSYKVRSLVREQPFWEALGRWFDFEAVQIGTRTPKEKEPPRPDGAPPSPTEPGSTTTSTAPPPPPPAPSPLTWARLGSAFPSSTHPTTTDELFIFVCTRWPSTFGFDARSVSDEQLLQGRGGARGEGAGAGRFEEMMLAGLEWD